MKMFSKNTKMTSKFIKGFVASIILLLTLTELVPVLFDFDGLTKTLQVTSRSRVKQGSTDDIKSFDDLKIVTLVQKNSDVIAKSKTEHSNAKMSMSSNSSLHSSSSSSSSFSSFSSSSHFFPSGAASGSIDYYNTHGKAFLNGLRHLGIESTELHDFKSRHIITPHIYYDTSNINTNNNKHNNILPYTVVQKAPGIRTTKIISFHNIARTSWIRTSEIFKKNRDFKQCPYSECFVDTAGTMEHKADMVWFLCSGFTNKDLKKGRPPGQLWAVGCWESPVHWRYPADQAWRSVFNLTVGPHHHMDINDIHSKVAWRDTKDLLLDFQYLAAAKNKTKTAAWFVSNCNAPSKRDEYVREMQKYIDVDIYGKCGPLKCPKSDRDVCEQRLNTTYKFYLSFENSFCEDYATYKFFGVFKREHFHVVPVVRSGFDYAKYMPKDTYINTKDFKSSKDLALFLKELGNDTERYAAMLKAKDKFVRMEHITDWCDICEGLHTGKFPGRVIKDAWEETHKGICWTPDDI